VPNGAAFRGQAQQSCRIAAEKGNARRQDDDFVALDVAAGGKMRDSCKAAS
jgi:hypothetical protein